MVLYKRMTLLGLIVVAVGMLFAAAAWACTILVGPTAGTTAAARGDAVAAEGEVFHGSSPGEDNFGENDSPCSDFGADGDELDAECLYSLGVVNPSKVHDPTGGTAWDPDTDPPEDADLYYSETCHYGTPQSAADSQFATIADHNAVEHLPDPEAEGARVLVGSGVLPAVDDVGDPMVTGETVMCFYSSKKLADSVDTGEAVNRGDNGAATATVPLPFVVLNE